MTVSSLGWHSAPARLRPAERDPTAWHALPDARQRSAPVVNGAVAALLGATDIPERWRQRERFVIVAIGAGALDAFRWAWQTWRDGGSRCAQLHVIALEGSAHGIASGDAARAVLRASTCALDQQLADAWPPSTPDLHRLAFEDGRVQLLVAAGDPVRWLRGLVASVDAFVLMDWTSEKSALLDAVPRFAKAIGRLAAPAATLWAGAVNRGSAGAAAPQLDADATAALQLDSAAVAALRAVGFRSAAAESRNVGAAHAPGLVALHYAPSHVPRAPIGRAVRPHVVEKRALIVGAGLAGCAAAWALAEQGWHSIVFEREPAIANAASGNPAGLFHGIVNGQDATHARFNRAAALEARRAAVQALAAHGVSGGVGGLLQLVDAHASVVAMRALLERLRLPESYVHAVDAEAASVHAGLLLERPAWLYPGGGWIDPAGLALSFLERAGSSVAVRLGQSVSALRRDGAGWELLDAAGGHLATAPTVVLANAGDALRLAGGDWPVEAVRGQISMLPRRATQSLYLPRLPITGGGYLLPSIGAVAIFGATSAAADSDSRVRLEDHMRNLDQLARLAPSSGAARIDPADLEGRTAWRWVSRDRLPLIGPVPRRADESFGRGARVERLDQPRFVPREPGLYMYTALGSRGITWAALGAQVLASSITGAPAPVEAGLLDALDPARFLVREQRRAGAV